MHDDTSLEHADGPRLSLWAAVALALGLLVHRAFFLLAALLVLVAPIGWLIEWLQKHEQQTAMQGRHT